MPLGVEGYSLHRFLYLSQRRAHVKQIGLTEYFRAGVKSHKSTCQELYKTDRELHTV